MRCIDADALIADCQLAQKQADRHGREFANAFYSGGGEVSTEWWCVEDMIENAPTIEPERKKGKWIDRGWSGDGRGNSWHEWECSECKHITKGAKWNFCPNCGADMREDAEEAKKCDTCKHEKEPWSMQCHRCETYNLWEGKR